MNLPNVEQNKQELIDLVNQISREFDKEQFIEMLEVTDFFTAPASAKYHSNIEGGLCQHTLNVYNHLKMLVNNMGLSDKISNDSILIVSICHDLSKINFYEKTFHNKKIYCESGSKKDGNGNFDWVSVPGWQLKNVNERFLYSNHESNSEYIAKIYFPLSIEESAAISNHHCTLAFDSQKDTGIVTDIYRRYPLACLLHIADMLSSYIVEEVNE